MIARSSVRPRLTVIEPQRTKITGSSRPANIGSTLRTSRAIRGTSAPAASSSQSPPPMLQQRRQ
eukprot:6154284-Pleurochrysis_carterae.AAC.3